MFTLTLVTAAETVRGADERPNVLFLLSDDHSAPPAAGQEASDEWYASQYPDPVIFSPIGPPSDPG